jgi:3-hydroxyisobutyrate dehydrogenase-like beta-hydroxyacid dehydrogenase
VQREPVLFVGVGKMGGRIARRLLAAGVPVDVYDENAGAMADLVAFGAVPVSSEGMGRLAYSQAVLCLPTPAIVATLLDRWFAGGIRQDAVVLDLTTMAPSVALGWSEKFRAADAFYLDVPLSGGERGAETGDLVVTASGARAAFDRVHPLLRQIGRDVHYAGESGAASLLKAINQYVYLAYNFAFAQGLGLARQLGLPDDAVMSLLTKGAPAHPLINDRLPTVIGSDFHAGFAMRRCLKDLDCLELPQDTDPHLLRLFELMRGDLRAAVQDGRGDMDILALGNAPAAPKTPV